MLEMSDKHSPATASGHIVAPTPVISFGRDNRSAFSLTYMEAAIAAAIAVHKAESAPELDINVLVPQGCIAIVLAATALEAYSNEVLADCLDVPENFSNEMNVKLNELWNSQNASVRAKLSAVAEARGRQFDFGDPVWEAAEVAQEFRHALVHFKPYWVSQQANLNDRRRRKVLAKFDKAPFIQGQLDFPRDLIHYKNCRICIVSVEKLTASFAAVAGVHPGPASATALTKLPPP
jgi:hypothetical protein